jgi:Predicted nucleoside-diphosphate-sugar epimerases
MFAITGITGKVGGAAARTLLAAGKPLRAVLRNPAKASIWAAQGAEVAPADIHDSRALATAMAGAEAVLLVPPPVFDPAPDFKEARAVAKSFKAALQQVRPARAVYLSTIGADAAKSNLLSQHSLIESELREMDLPLAFLRPAWFLDNIAWDIAPARTGGRFDAFLQPLDHAIAMVAAEDVGRTAAALLQEDWQGQRIIELAGPQKISSTMMADALARALDKKVTASPVARTAWEQMFEAQGMANPGPRIAMLDGFNQGWITFCGRHEQRHGTITLDAVIAGLLQPG